MARILGGRLLNNSVNLILDLRIERLDLRQWIVELFIQTLDRRSASIGMFSRQALVQGHSQAVDV